MISNTVFANNDNRKPAVPIHVSLLHFTLSTFADRAFVVCVPFLVAIPTRMMVEVLYKLAGK